MAADSVKPRVVSGMRPTGKLHLGHLVGALRQWTELQRDYSCMYFVADWHALTSDYADTRELIANAYDNVADWIAAGIDPDESTIFVQSLVPEHAELALLLSMVVPIPWLERVPTYKEQIDQLSDRDLSTLTGNVLDDREQHRPPARQDLGPPVVSLSRCLVRSREDLRLAAAGRAT